MPIKMQRHARMTERQQTEAEFEQFYSGVVKKSEGMTDPPVQPCYKRIHQKLVSGSENHRHTDVKVYYRQQYYEVLDSVTGELVRRFHQKNFLVKIDIEACDRVASWAQMLLAGRETRKQGNCSCCAV
ncbi:UNVERIFIED_CONTAM: hypothetical protein FKN15_049387 [Acipenser sinensis]